MVAVRDPGWTTGGAQDDRMARVLLDNATINGFDTPAPGSVRVPSGVLIVDKPEGMTSFQTVRTVARRLGVQKAGHCGTLDPFATGVLLVCLNQATRISDQLAFQNKRYLATLRMGIETDTLDRTGQVVREHVGGAVTIETFRKALEGFRGKLMQRVPSFSAVHVDGRRLYEYARRGIPVEAPVREVCIERLDLTGFEWPFATLDVSCGKGTYLRQLAADLGRHLGCGAHLTALRRLESGPFRIEQSVSLDALSALDDPGKLQSSLVPMSEALSHLRHVTMEDERLLTRLMEGSLEATWEDTARRSCPTGFGPVRILDARKVLRALWWPEMQGEHGRKLRVFKN